MGARILAFALSVAAFVLAPSSAPAGYGPGEILFTFTDPRITESSGLASSARTDEILFTHNDSGDTARFFAVDRSGDTVATFGLGPTVQRAIDWEDMARGPGGDGGPALYLADIGDNARARPAVVVYEVPEPEVDLGAPGVSRAVPPNAVHVLVYEDGPHDAETLLVDPATGALAIVTKDASGQSGLYAAVDLLAGLPKLLRRVATIGFDELGGGLLATGGDVSPDGTRLVVRTYEQAFEWTIPGGDLAAAVGGVPLSIALPPTPQGEAIAYTRDGADLVTTTEGGLAPAHLVPGTP